MERNGSVEDYAYSLIRHHRLVLDSSNKKSDRWLMITKLNWAEAVSALGQIFAYLLGAVVIWQLLKAIWGGTWRVEDIILALMVLNLTMTFGTGGYLIHLNNKISSVNTKIEGHFRWHDGLAHKK